MFHSACVTRLSVTVRKTERQTDRWTGGRTDRHARVRLTSNGVGHFVTSARHQTSSDGQLGPPHELTSAIRRAGTATRRSGSRLVSFGTRSNGPLMLPASRLGPCRPSAPPAPAIQTTRVRAPERRDDDAGTITQSPGFGPTPHETGRGGVVTAQA